MMIGQPIEVKDPERLVRRRKKLNADGNNVKEENGSNFVNLAPGHPLICPILSSSRDISCAHLSLKRFPGNIGHFENLCSIDLSHNLIEFIPESIGSLKQLKSIWFSHNWIREFPVSLTECSRLEYLDLRYNQIATIPKEISRMINLRRLLLISNAIEYLPAEMGLLANRLDCLLLERNVKLLATIPPTVERCRFHERGILLYLLDSLSSQSKTTTSDGSYCANPQSLLEKSAIAIISEFIRYKDHPESIENYFDYLHCDMHECIFEQMLKLPLHAGVDAVILNFLSKSCSNCTWKYSDFLR
eukprot:Nk52_evm9s470 gene=Nk52_evmTU9s470